MNPGEKKTETDMAAKKIDEIIERSRIQSRILKKVLTQLKKESKSLDSEEVKPPKKGKK